MIQRVVEFGAKLKGGGFPRPCHRESFDQRKVKVLLPWRLEDAHAGITEAHADRIVGAEHSGSGKATRVDVGLGATDVRFDGAWIYELAFDRPSLSGKCSSGHPPKV